MGAQIWVLGQTDRVSQHLSMPLWLWRQMARTLPGPGRYSGQGRRVLPVRSTWTQSGQSGLLLGLPQGVCFTLGPESRSGDRPRLWLGGRWRAHMHPGPRVLSARGVFRVALWRWRPATGVVRVGWERRVWSPVGSGSPRRLLAHMLFLCQSPDGAGDVWMDRTLLRGWLGRALDPSACPHGSRSLGATLLTPLNSLRSVRAGTS